MSKRPVSFELSFYHHIHWQHLVAGVTGGVLSTLIVHPLDLIKIRFQVNEGSHLVAQRPHYSSITNAVSSIFKQNGVRGLYQGVTPNIWGAGTSWGLYFLAYNALKTYQNVNGDMTLSPPMHMAAAAEAGMFTLLLTNPIWVAKTRLCLQYDTHPSQNVQLYTGMFDCLYKIYQFEGLKGLYKGLLPGIFGVSHGALQFMAYEELKKQCNKYHNELLNKKLSTFQYLYCAALSKIFAATLTYPYQVVRARLQDQHRSYVGVSDVIQQMWRYEGMKAFYKGLIPGVLRVTPACCITFVVYENMISLLMVET